MVHTVLCSKLTKIPRTLKTTRYAYHLRSTSPRTIDSVVTRDTGSIVDKTSVVDSLVPVS